MRASRLGLFVLALAAGCSSGTAVVEARGFDVAIIVDGVTRPELYARGRTYVEALRGREYTIRLTNPLGRRVAVALSVDGVNTIDAERTDPRRAAKWVLSPYETIEISGWQVNGAEARQFCFTGERDGYATWLGRTDDLGLIEAVFFVERHKLAPFCEQLRKGVLGGARAAPEASDEYAATGAGRRVDHRVRRVHLDLEDRPAARVQIRYEFRPQLVRLGILPYATDPMNRRESATGFDDRWCPDPPVQ